MANKVACEETKVECSLEMNDRDYLNDILASEKCITSNTVVALTEASNSKIHEEFLNFFDTVQELQAKTYELAWNMGWYTIEEAEENKKSQSLKKLEKLLKEMES